MAVQKVITRDFLLCFFSQFVFSFVYYILMPILPIFLSQKEFTEIEIGVLIGIFSVSSLCIRPVIGRALLRIPERKFMMGGTLIYSLCPIVYLLAYNFGHFLIARIFQGIGFAFFFTASFTLIANMSPEANRGQSFSYFYLALNIAFALAPSFGMILLNLSNFTFVFVVCTGISLFGLLLTTRLRKRQPDSLQDLRIHDRSFLSRDALPPAVMAFFTHIIWGAMTAFFPLYALGNGITNPGVFFGSFAIVLILSRSLGGKILDLYPREKVIFPCLTAYIISMIILAFSKTLIMFILVAIIWGVGSAFLTPALVAFAVDRAGSSRGPAMGTFMAISDLGTGVGSVIMGVILRLTSYQIMFFCLALTGFINLFYFYFFVRKVSLGKLVRIFAPK